jgi:hypothetical protein
MSVERMPLHEKVRRAPSEQELPFRPAIMILWAGSLSAEAEKLPIDLRLGDKILFINGVEVLSQEEIDYLIPQRLTIQRGGETVDVTIPGDQRKDLWKNFQPRPVESRSFEFEGKRREQFRVVYDFSLYYEDLPAEVVATYEGIEKVQLAEDFAESRDLPREGMGFRLGEFLIRNTQTRKSLDLKKKTNASNYSILCLRTSYREVSALDAADTVKKEIIGGVPDLPLTLGILLHELGHAEQFEKDVLYKELAELDQIGRLLRNGNLPYVFAPDFARLFKMIPHLKEDWSLDETTHLCDEYLRLKEHALSSQSAVVEMLAKKRDMTEDELIKFRRFRKASLHDGKTYGERTIPEIEELRTERREAFADEMKDLLSEGKQPFLEALQSWQRAMTVVSRYSVLIEDAFYVAVQMMERDATRRAFRWMRQIRDEIGIDLLRPIALKDDISDEEVLKRADFSELPADLTEMQFKKSVLRKELLTGKRCVSVPKYLEDALGSYEATTSQMKSVHKRVPVPKNQTRPIIALWSAKESLKLLGKIAKMLIQDARRDRKARVERGVVHDNS